MGKIQLSASEIQAFDFKVARALRLLLFSKPLYYYVTAKLNKTYDANFPYPAAVTLDRRTFQARLILNPAMCKDFTVEDLKILFEHEALHLCFKHLFSINKFSHQLYNQATDYIINDNIEDLRSRYTELMSETPSNTIFAAGCLAPKIQNLPELKGISIAQMDSFTLCEILKKNGADDQNTFDDHSGKSDQSEGEPGGDSDAKGIQELSQSAVDRLVSEAAQESMAHKKTLGNVPGEIERRIKELTKSSTNYRVALQNFAANLRENEQERTWTRRNRKYPNQVRGKRTVYQPKLIVIIDTSGSMNDLRIQKAIAGEVKAVSAVCREVWIVCGDTKETYRTKIKNGRFKLENIRFDGGGGTSLQFGWEMAKEKDVDGVLCYTDGYIDPVQTHGIKSLFCIYPGGRDVPNHKNIKMAV